MGGGDSILFIFIHSFLLQYDDDLSGNAEQMERERERERERVCEGVR
jgi:hypothetical protein